MTAALNAAAIPTGTVAPAARTAIAFAEQHLGDPYVWGAAGPSQFDCSGLVVWAYAQEGITLPHYTGWLWNSGVHVARSDLEPGDLVFFGDGSYAYHVGIYAGNGMMYDSPRTGKSTSLRKIFSDSAISYGRV